jgi:NADPH-dependent curcumin reductase
MPAGINRQWRLANRPEGMVGEHNFRWVESPIPSPAEGQVLVRNLWLSFDPTQRGWMSHDTYVPAIPIGEVMLGGAVGQVVESRNPDFRAGDMVQGLFGWEDYTVTDGRGFVRMTKLPTGVPPNLALGVLGLTGMTAYFGVIEHGRPKKGETFLVSDAAGAVGSIAGQIAKIHGLRVVGTAGGKEKCDWLLREAGFDGAIDYRSENVGARLSTLCPEGIDIFFDNVGGSILDEALARLRRYGRVVLCGAISRYQEKVPSPGPVNYLSLVARHGRMEGFLMPDYADRIPEAVGALSGWLRSGQLKSKEDVAAGLENAPKTLARLFTGANFGKQLLKIADPAVPSSR